MKSMFVPLISVLVLVSPLFAESESGNSANTESLLAVEQVRQFMQERNYAQAIKAIDEAAAAKDAPRDRLTYLKGRALFLQKDYDAANAQFDAVQKEFPQSPWARHARFGKALSLSRKGDFRGAEAIMRGEAEYLLSPEWKRQIADIYLEFAEQNFVPAKEEQKPDYAKALKFYGEAIEVEPKAEKREEIELRIAECRQKLGKPDEAIALYERFVKEHPESRLDIDARFYLGECYMAQSNWVLARWTFQDLLDKYVDSPSGRVAEASYQLSHTWQMPKPASDEDLNQGLAALAAFLERFPKHKLAGQAHLEIAEGLMHRERHADAALRLQQFLQDERFKDSEQIPDARILLGRCYQLQKKFPEALAVWRDYLVKHPAHKQWSDIQREIIDTEYLAACDRLEAKDFDVANKLFGEFLAKYPLDPRNPNILLMMNRKLLAEEKWDEAIAAWRKVVSKYPQTDPASQAQFSIAETLEKKLGKFEEALEEYRKVTWGSSQTNALQAIGRFTAPAMTVATERVFRSNETPKLKLTTRNIESVTVRIYNIDLETYFRKMHVAWGVEALDVALIDADKTFEFKVPKYAKYQELASEIEVPLPGGAHTGATAVTVSSKTLETTTLVVQSDLDVIVKSSRDEVFVFAQNMLTGKPWSGARLLISNGKQVFAEETTGKDGVFQKSYKELGDTANLRVFAAGEGSIASNRIGLQGIAVARGLADKGFLYTDRPVYRAGQPVHIRGCLRHASGDAYTIEAGKKYTLEIHDARSRLLRTEQVALGEFGTFHTHFLLPSTSPSGKYRIALHDDAKQNYAGEFLVRGYQVEPIQLTIDSPRRVYYRGEEIEGTIRAAYSYGSPLAGSEIRYQLADGRQNTATTDAKGEIHFKLPTRDFNETQVLALVAQLPGRKVETQTNFVLAVQEFAIEVEMPRPVYLADESFEITVRTRDAEGKPIGEKLSLKVLERTTVQNKVGERQIEEHPLETAAADGTVRKSLKLAKGGSYTLRLEGIDRFKNPISTQSIVQISDDKDPCRLRIIADKQHFKVGDNATVQLHWRESPVLALVTFQGAKVLDYKLVDLKTGANELVIPMTAALAPNFDLAVAVMNDPRPVQATAEKENKQANLPAGHSTVAQDRQPHILAQFGGSPAPVFPATVNPPPVELWPKSDEQNKPVIRFHEASSPFYVERELKVKLVAKHPGQKPDSKESLRPGEDVEVTVDTTDSQGKPVAAEVSLAMIERSLLERFGGQLTTIEDYFHGLDRQSAMRTVSSISFAYHPATRPINTRLLAEEERAEISREEEKSRTDDIPFRQNATDNPFDDPSEKAVAEDGRADTAGGAAGYGFGGAMGAGRIKPYETNLSIIVKQDQEVHEDIADLDDPTLVKPATSDSQKIRDQSGNQHLATADIDRLRELISRNCRQVVILNKDGTMKTVNLTSEVAGQPPTTLAEMADELMKDGAVLLPNLETPETGYWNPALVTDKEGKATATFTLPEQSTAWSLLAKGITTDTLTGENSQDLVVKKNLFGQLKLPTAFTDGDEAEILASIHNTAIEQGQFDVTLKTTIADRTVEEKKTIDVKAKGVAEVSFKTKLMRPETAASSAEVMATFELTVAPHAQGGEKTENSPHPQPLSQRARGAQEIAADVMRRSVPLQPYGTQVFATASGSAMSDTTAWIEPTQAMPLSNPSLQIFLGPTVEQSMMDIVLGAEPLCQREIGRIASGIEATTSDLLASLALQKLAAASQQAGGPRTEMLDARVQAAIGTLVTSQNSDGGWSWTIGSDSSGRFDTARAIWALGLAKKAGYKVPDACYNTALNYLQKQMTAVANTDYESKAILLHALATAGKGDFSLANRLYRERPALSAAALAYLALAFVEMDRNQTAGELLDVLAKRDLDDQSLRRKTERGLLPCSQSPVELRALYALALEQVSPQSPKVKELVDWLLAHRTGYRFSPDKATGPAALALCRWFAESRFEGERYKLVISVNGAEAANLDIDPAAGGRVIDVPAALLKKEGKQQINFQLTGRGRYAYQCILGGFVPAETLKNTTENWTVTRIYEPAPLEVDGREVPRGFKILQGKVEFFRNPLTQLPVGRRGRVELKIERLGIPNNTSEDQLEYLVVTEPTPNGAAVVEQTIRGGFERYEITPGAITFFVGTPQFAPISYELHGYLPGNYRAAPTVVRDAHRPERLAVSVPKTLAVLPAGEKSGDAYRLTPEELFELGKIHFQKGDFKTASAHLGELFAMKNVEPSTYRKMVEMLLDVHLQIGPPAEIVRYFEIIKEKWPDAEIPFAKIVKVGAAYEEMGEFERSYLIFRATVESSFFKEIGVAGFLESQGEFYRSVETMERLLRAYPPEGYAAAAQYALAQHVYAKAADAAGDADLRKRKINRVDLTRRAWAMLENFMTAYPDDPAADQAAFAAASTLLELKWYKEAAAACERFIKRYPQSELIDSFWYVIGYCHYALGEDQQALEMCRKVAETVRTDPATGRETESRNKWQAIYILGQIYHSMGKPAEAITEYRRVEDRYSDAKQSIEYFLRQAIDLPEVTTVKPGTPAAVEMKFRNIAACDVRVYRIDLMKFGLLNRNLAGISQINLAGIRPLHEENVKLGDGKDYRDRTHKFELPVKEEGAYLVVCRGEDLHAGGLVLVTPIAVEVQEDQVAGQVRAIVKDVVADRYLHEAQVKIIGTGNDDFTSGETDLRGVFTAENIRGSATVIAESGGSRYAFFRSPNYMPGGPREGGGGVARQVKSTKNIEEALDSATRFAFNDAKLSAVVDYLKQLHGIEIVLDTKAINDLGITPDTPVTKNLTGISLRSGLRLILKDLGLTTMISDGVLMITSPDTADNSLMTKIYPVSDLVEYQDTDGVKSCDFDSLIDMITKTIKPTTWDCVGGSGSVQPFQTNLSIVVSQTQEVHEEMEDLLANIRKVSKEQGLEGVIPVRPKTEPNAMQGMGGMGAGMGGGMGGMGMGGMGGGAGMGGMAPAARSVNPPAAMPRASATAPVQKTDLLKGLNDTNRAYQGQQGEKLQQMYKNGSGGMGGVSAGKAF